MTAKKPDSGVTRRKGEGSIIWLASRNSWRYERKVGKKLDGKPDKITVYARTLEDERGQKGLYTKIREAEDKRAKKFKSPDDYTFADCVRDWLEFLHEQMDDEDISPQTLRIYSSLAKHYISNPIGKIRMADLFGQQVYTYLKSVREDMVQHSLYMLLRVAKESVRYAQTRGLVDEDTAQSIRVLKPPKGHSAGRPTKNLSLEQFFALLEYARLLWEGGSDQLRWLWPYVALTLLCGVRPEEARGLKWEWIDLAERIVWVEESARFQGRVKTKASRRRIKLLPIAAVALQEFMLYQAARRASAGKLWHETGCVFTTDLGEPLTNGQVRSPFTLLCKRAGVGDNWVPRETRATFATLLHDHGLEVSQIAAALGHAKDSAVTEKHYIKPALPPLVDVTPALAELLEMAQAANRAAKAAVTSGN